MKTRRDYGFGTMVDSGKTPEEIMAHFCLSRKQYENQLKELDRIRAEDKENKEKKKSMENEITIKLKESEFAAIWIEMQKCYRSLPDTVRQKFRLGEFAPRTESDMDNEPSKTVNT